MIEGSSMTVLDQLSNEHLCIRVIKFSVISLNIHVPLLQFSLIYKHRKT